MTDNDVSAISENTKKERKKELNAVEENYKELSKPICLTNFFVNRPVLMLTISAIILASVTLLCIVAGWFIDSQSTNRDYLIWDDPKTINYDKSNLAKAALIAGKSTVEGEKLPL